MTEAQADILLREMLQGFEEKLDKFLQENYITLRDNQYDALISLTYNIGSGWMKESALATLLKNGTYSNNELASAIGIWCHVKSNGVTSIHDGLVARVGSEMCLRDRRLPLRRLLGRGDRLLLGPLRADGEGRPRARHRLL